MTEEEQKSRVELFMESYGMDTEETGYRITKKAVMFVTYKNYWDDYGTKSSLPLWVVMGFKEAKEYVDE